MPTAKLPHNYAAFTRQLARQLEDAGLIDEDESGVAILQAAINLLADRLDDFSTETIEEEHEKLQYLLEIGEKREEL